MRDYVNRRVGGLEEHQGDEGGYHDVNRRVGGLEGT